MTLRDFLKVLRQRWLIILICTLVAAGFMWWITPARTDTTQRIGSYTATSTLLVGVRDVPQPQPTGRQTAAPAPVQPQAASLGRIALYIKTGEIPRRAAAATNFTDNPALLASGVTVDSDPTAQSIRISVTAADGNRAAEVANAFANEAVRYFEEAPAGAGDTRLMVLEEATPIPNQPGGGFVIPPDRTIRTALAALIGLLFGLALALVLDRLDSRLRTRSEVHDGLHMPVIAEVPRLARNRRGEGKIEMLNAPLSIYADGYRAARSAIMHIPSQPVPGEWTEPRRSVESEAAVASTSRVILVTSAHAGEGKTTSVANLAASFAETGQSVLVLDADLRSPDAHLLFDVPQGAGISDLLTDPTGSSVEGLMRPTNVPGVRILTAGTRLDYPAALSSRMAPLIEQARKSADIVLVDAAPLLAASDVFDILPLVDTIVLVSRSGRLTEVAANRVAELLGRFRVPVLGVILIGAPIRKADGYGAGYGYGQPGGKRGLVDRRHALPHREEPADEEGETPVLDHDDARSQAPTQTETDVEWDANAAEPVSAPWEGDVPTQTSDEWDADAAEQAMAEADPERAPVRARRRASS